jgi:putative Mn2+ efflux pump MntP
MEIFTILIIAIGLSMDSFAVSLSNGLCLTNLRIKKILSISFSLSIFQALMPLLGWLAGTGIENSIREFDHWIAFILLGFIGGKMIYDGIYNTNKGAVNELKFTTLMAQSFATSIDAFAVGISFALLNISIITPIIIIGVTTFGFSLLGLQIGKFFGKRIGKPVEIFGGLVLLGIGTKILIEHLYFH